MLKEIFSFSGHNIANSTLHVSFRVEITTRIKVAFCLILAMKLALTTLTFCLFCIFHVLVCFFVRWKKFTGVKHLATCVTIKYSRCVCTYMILKAFFGCECAVTIFFLTKKYLSYMRYVFCLVISQFITSIKDTITNYTCFIFWFAFRYVPIVGEMWREVFLTCAAKYFFCWLFLFISSGWFSRVFSTIRLIWKRNFISI